MTANSSAQMTRLSDNQTQYDKDEFIVEISLFDEFEDEDEMDILPVTVDQHILH